MTLRSTAPPLWGTVLSQSMRRFPLNKECQTHYKIAVVLRISDSLLNCCSFVIWHWLITLLSPCEIFLSISLDICVCAKSLQSCLTLGDSMDCIPPGSSVHGILRARILERVAISSSRRSSRPRDRTLVSHVFCVGRWVLYHQHYLGSPIIFYTTSKLLFPIKY